MQSIVAFFSAVTFDNVVDIATVLIALWSAVIAGRATRVAARTLEDQRKGRIADRRSEYYRTVVVEAALAEVPAYIREARDLLNVGEAEMLAMDDGLPRARFVERAQTLTEAFKQRHHDLETRLLAGARAWGDDAFFDAVAQRLDTIEDDITLAIDRLISPNAPPAALATTLSDRASGLLGAIVAYGRELTESDEELPALPPPQTPRLPPGR